MDLFQLALVERGVQWLSSIWCCVVAFRCSIELVVTAEIRLQVSSGMKQDNRDVVCRAGSARLSVENNEWPA